MRLLPVEQVLAVQLQGADLGVDEPLDLVGTDADLVGVPQPAELLAPPEQELGEVRGP